MPRKNKQMSKKKQQEVLTKGEKSIKEATNSTYKKILKLFDSLKKQHMAGKKEDNTRHAKVMKMLNMLTRGMAKFDTTAKELINKGGFGGANKHHNEDQEELVCEKCSEMERTLEILKTDIRRQKAISEEQITKIEQQAEEAMDEIEKEHKNEFRKLATEKRAIEEQLELRQEEAKMLEVALAEGLSTKVSVLQAALYKAEKEKDAAIKRADRIAQDVMEFKTQAALQAKSMRKQSLVRIKKKRKSFWEKQVLKRQRSSSRPFIQERWR